MGSFSLFLPEDFAANGFPSSSCSSSPSSASSSSSPGSIAQSSYIEHQVSKLDTLAGVAIKYGVEVADIKKMNSLITDLQMFALKTLKIPSPGRHPPSPMTPTVSSSKRNQDVLTLPQKDLLKTPQRKISHAMSNLLGYYGLNDPKVEGTEMAVYGPKISPMSANPSPSENYGSEKPVRRRQKVEDEGIESLSGKSDKGFTPKPKSGIRIDFDPNFLAATPVETLVAVNGVKKSSSTSNLVDSERSSSTWLTSKWLMKPETASNSKPLFDGLPRPITFRRSKAAMD